MPITRDPSNLNGIVDYTTEINELDRQFMIFDENLFDVRSTSQTSVIFDRNQTATTLLPAVSRGAKGSTYGKEDAVSTYSLPLAYFKHSDYITSEDVQGVRRHGTPDSVESSDLVRAEKLENMRRIVDQTHEYMKLQAAKGVVKSPDGVVFADMFNEFGVTQDTIDFDLGTASTDVAGKVRQLRRLMRDNLKNGGLVNGVDVYVDPLFFDKLISHAEVKEAYKYFAANDQLRAAQPLRDNLSDVFTFGGVRFISLDGSFNMPNGAAEQLVDDNTGHAIPVAPGLFRGWVGPSNKLAMSNQAGQDMFAWSYTDPKGEYEEMQVETSPLFICTRPKALIKLTSST